MYAFVAPEMTEAQTDVSGFESKSSWDVAIRFQDLKRFGHIPDKEKAILKKRAVEGVLQRAHQILGAAAKKEKIQILSHDDYEQAGARGDIDILSTLEESIQGLSQNPKDFLRYEARVEKNPDIELIMDASLSMTGEKIALLAVAVAVVALCVPSTHLALMGFDSKTTWLKHFSEELTLPQIIEKVLELPAGGFTNLEQALEESLRDLKKYSKPRTNVILISDGKYTEGNDPAYLAPQFTRLNVLKIGRDQAGRNLLVDLTSKGGGKFFEAKKLSELPRVMYGALKQLV